MSRDDADLPILPPERVLALEALLAGKTTAEAASACGRSERAVRYWVRTATFQAALRDFQDAARSHVRMRTAAAAEAATRVVAVCLDPPEGADARVLTLRLAAARLVLELLGITGSNADASIDEIDEGKLEEALRARGWVKRSEIGACDA